MATKSIASPADRAASLLMEAEITVEKMLRVIKKATDPESEYLGNQAMYADLKAQERQRRNDRMLDAMGDDGMSALDSAVAARRAA